MAIQISKPITATASQYASAAMHLEMRGDWRTIRIDNVRYVVLVSGTSGRVYWVRADAGARSCRCIWSENSTTPCSHRLAVDLAATEDELREGLASLDATAFADYLTATYAPLFSRCAGGCGDSVEVTGERCWACLSEQTRRETMAAARARVLKGWGE